MTDPGKKIQLPGIFFLKQFSHVFMQTGSGLIRKPGCVKTWAYLNTKIIVDKHKHWCYNVGCTIVVAYAYALE